MVLTEPLTIKAFIILSVCLPTTDNFGLCVVGRLLCGYHVVHGPTSPQGVGGGAKYLLPLPTIKNLPSNTNCFAKQTKFDIIHLQG